MPRRHDNDEIKQKFINAGFIPDNEFKYKNNKTKYRVYDILNNKYTRISLQQLDYNIKKGHRPLWEALPIDETVEDTTSNDPLQRFIRSHSKQESFQQLPLEQQQETFNNYQKLRHKIMRKQPFTYNFDQSELVQTSQMRAVIMALNDSLSKIMPRYSIRLKITTTNNHERYFHINPTTLSDLWAIFKDIEPDFSVEDSAGNFALDTMNIKDIEFNFKPHKQGHQVAAGFFPFKNISNIDLTKYGIYNSANDHRITEPCIITAFRNSNILTQDELNQLKEMINTRVFPQVYLKHIHEHFHINIYVKHYHEDANKSKSSHVDYNNTSYNRSIRLMILYNHYMIYEKVNNNKYNYSLIKDMVKNKQLIPFTAKEYEQIFANIIEYSSYGTAGQRPYKPITLSYNNSRPIVIKPPKPLRAGLTKIPQNKHFFGYEPNDDEIDLRLNEIQEFVNTLPLKHRINIKTYFKFSSLMQRIMYEFGCFDDVYEIAGSLRDSIRNELTFPGRELTTDTINEKCYYLDFNGAFTSFMTHIPTGPKGDSQGNTKINDLIKTLYNKRIEAKQQGNTRLATTIKFMMNSAYGASIRKPKLIKHKYSNNIQGTINNQGDLVVSHENKDAGFVNIVQPYVEHYSYPHFAKVILDGFNNKLNEIKSHVNVLFQNIDAIVVNEADYNKLNELGYIHPTELGKLKVEHVFKSMTFYNKMRWIGINEDNSEFRHCC